MNKFAKWLVGSLMVLVAHAALALDGTNAVSILSDNVNNASGTVWPIVIGIIGALVTISVFMKVGRKAGVRA